MILKYIWAGRALVYKFFFGSLKLPSYIGNPIYIGKCKKIFIGRYVRIFPHVRMEVVDDNSSITIKDNVSIAQNFHITSGGNLIIGESTVIAENVMITNIDHEYQEIGKPILDQSYIIKETEIGMNCFIGFGAVIQAGTILGKHCVVGANSVVRGHYPDYSVIVGAPSRIVKRFNEETNKWEKTDKEGNFKIH